MLKRKFQTGEDHKYVVINSKQKKKTPADIVNLIMKISNISINKTVDKIEKEKSDPIYNIKWHKGRSANGFHESPV